MLLARLKQNKGFLGLLAVLGVCTISQLAFASDATIGSIAQDVTKSFTGIGQLMIAASYIAGFGLTVASLFKFKQHKDNPQQAPMGTAIALLVLGVLLVFLPSLFGPAGTSVFGTDAEKGGAQGAGFDEGNKSS